MNSVLFRKKLQFLQRAARLTHQPPAPGTLSRQSPPRTAHCCFPGAKACGEGKEREGGGRGGATPWAPLPFNIRTTIQHSQQAHTRSIGYPPSKWFSRSPMAWRTGTCLRSRSQGRARGTRLCTSPYLRASLVRATGQGGRHAGPPPLKTAPLLRRRGGILRTGQACGGRTAECVYHIRRSRTQTRPSHPTQATLASGALAGSAQSLAGTSDLPAYKGDHDITAATSTVSFVVQPGEATLAYCALGHVLSARVCAAARSRMQRITQSTGGGLRGRVQCAAALLGGIRGSGYIILLDPMFHGVGCGDRRRGVSHWCRGRAFRGALVVHALPLRRR